MKDFFLAVLSFLVAVFIVILFVAFGWYLLWVLILSRFKFVRDLLNSAKNDKGSPSPVQLSQNKTKKTRKD